MRIPRAPVPAIPPIWRESRYGLEWAGLQRSDVLRGAGVPEGDGRGVLLIPGFLAGDGSLATMTTLAARRGLAHQARGDPRQRRLQRGGVREARGAARGARAADRRPRRDHRPEPRRRVGQGARRAPPGPRGRRDRARRAGALPAGRPSARARAGRRRRGARARPPRPASSPSAACAASAARASAPRSAGPFPDEVGYVSLYSRSDGIVDWRSCLDPAADELVEVRASHCGMSVNADAYRAIAAALRGFGARERTVWARAA